MATSYPGGLDEFDPLTPGPSGSKQSQIIGGRSHAEHHNDLGDAVEAIQAELGTDPAGSSDTVKARIAAAETAISGKANTSHTHAEGDVTGLTSALAGKAASSHTHAQSDVTDLGDDLDLKLDITNTGFVLQSPNGAQFPVSVSNKGVLIVGKDDPVQSGLIMHLDAQDSDTITITSGKVSKWTDKIGNREFVQATDGNRPVLGTMNGRQSMLSAGGNKFLTSSAAVALSAPYTIIQVVKSESTANTQRIPLSSGSSAAFGFHYPASPHSGKWCLWTSASDYKSVGTFDTNPVTVRTQISGASSSFTVGADTTSFTATTAPATMQVGAYNSAAGWDGHICEILIYNKALSSDEIDNIEGYLNRRWGL
ncbi:MAG: hypothetical protein WAS05_00855 [Candidatus Nanopelagicales bacterium]